MERRTWEYRQWEQRKYDVKKKTTKTSDQKGQLSLITREQDVQNKYAGGQKKNENWKPDNMRK